MSARYILTQYIEEALSQAIFEELEDGRVCGRIPPAKAVIAFAPTQGECANELRSVLEEWILLGLKLGHTLPSINDINLNGLAYKSLWVKGFGVSPL